MAQDAGSPAEAVVEVGIMTAATSNSSVASSPASRFMR